MRYFRVKAFTGIQNQAEETDQDRGSLVKCENAVPYPKGCIRAAPVWSRVYENYNLAANPSNLSALLDTNQHRIVVGKQGAAVTSLAWFANNGTPNRIPAGVDLTPLSASNSLTGKIFINRVGSELFCGNGTEGNLRWGEDTAYGFVALAPTTGYYAQASQIFPACTSFVVGPDKAIYASGNAASPMKVYVSEPATIANPDHEDAVQGIFSGILSTVDIIMSEATEITALSSFRNYIVVHTDAGVALLYRTAKSQAGTGFRVEQTASPTVAGAVNPNCVSASMGVRPFYLGTDGQIYKDESARAGQDHVTEGRPEEIISWKAVNAWDRHMDKDLTDSFTAFEPSSVFFAAFVPHLSADTDMGFPSFLHNGETFQLSGPNLYPRFQAVTRVTGTSALLGIDQNLKFWTTDLDALRETAPFNEDQTGAGQLTPKVWLKTGTGQPDVALVTGDNDLVVTGNEEVLLLEDYDPSDMLDIVYEQESPAPPIGYAGPFAEPEEVALDIVGKEEYPASTLTVIETAFEDMGLPEGNKHFMEVVLKFKTESKGYMGVYAETEDGLVAGRWMDTIAFQDTHKVFIDLRGKQLKLRVFIITRIDLTWLLKDISIGHILQNTL